MFEPFESSLEADRIVFFEPDGNKVMDSDDDRSFFAWGESEGEGVEIGVVDEVIRVRCSDIGVFNQVDLPVFVFRIAFCYFFKSSG